jgi:pyruvate dehydrogenase E2 component (dihydrolipoamide acetyltransferase)
VKKNILMPKLGLTMEFGTIVRWNKEVGDEIVHGDMLLEVESDKSLVEVESEYEGVIVSIEHPEGSEVPCGEVIAVVGSEEDMKSSAPSPAASSHNSGEHTAHEDSMSEQITGDIRPKNKSVRISPRARKKAAEHDIDITDITAAFGELHQIEEKHVEIYIENLHSENQGESITGHNHKVLSKAQIHIAQKLTEAKRNIPHFYLRNAVKMQNFLEMWKSIKSKNSENPVSLNAVLIKMTGLALKKHPLINAFWGNDKIILNNTIDIALAVASKVGIVTPVITKCDVKDIFEIEAELHELIPRAREGSLPIDAYTNYTFTITNLGMYGIDDFTAIVNPPAAAILAIAAIKTVPAEKDGQILFIPTMNMTMSCDHRIIDGVSGALFMKDLKDIIEQPVPDSLTNFDLYSKEYVK